MALIDRSPARRVAAAARILVVSLLWAWSALGSQGASAKEAKALNVTQFKFQATEAVSVAGPLTPTNWGYENKPIAFTQAGGHPNGLTTTIDFETEQVWDPIVNEYLTGPTRDPKDVIVDLPPGLIGDPMAVPRCPLKQALGLVEPCPAATQVGIARVNFERGDGVVGPIVNVVPEAGQSAEFAIETSSKVSALLTAHLVRVENPETHRYDYSFDVASRGITDQGIYSVETTFWGVPAASVHDPERGLFCERRPEATAAWSCGLSFSPISGLGGEEAGIAPAPFLTWQTNCSAGRERVVMRADSWEQPGHVGPNGKYEGYVREEAEMPGATSCDLLHFNAGTGIRIEPDKLLADSPVGLGVKLAVPLNEKPQTNAAPELRDTVVTLPPGMSISPGAVNGIRACEELGPEGINIDGPESEEPGPSGELQLAPGHCPDASAVGTAEAITPFLPEPVTGTIYLARPGCGNAALGQRPCTEQDALDGNLYKLYLEIGGKGALADEGIVFKVPFEVEVNPATGQLTTNVRDLVQAPYNEVRLHLNGDQRAPLANPASCGPATTTADFTPWSAPGVTPEGLLVAGTPDLLSSSFFNVEGCAGSPGLRPGFLAGTVTPNAGKFSAFTMNVSRGDREQYVKGVQLHTPPGLLARLASVPLCSEVDADAGTCPPSSKIGTTRVATGAGEEPFEVAGDVYLTGPYRGAPFGLSVVTRAVAGPFNLGIVVVRARIDIDRHDSTAWITTDETGPFRLPQILFGIPLRLKRITVSIDRPDFMFNPTNCSGAQIDATVSGAQQTIAHVSSPFAVGGCRSLAFKPKFTASTNAHTSRAKGASLDVELSYPKGAMGNDANIARVKVSLPKQLPSYLHTLQRACLANTFEQNPAACPKESIVGIAKTKTPLLPVGLEGPVYFVSHGGEAFPSLVVVLEGDGVRVDLTGSTFISKGITSSTFKAVPDVPVESFELYLPQSRDHALSANGDLCKATSVVAFRRRVTRRGGGRLVHDAVTVLRRVRGLFMPTEFVAQNGAVIHQQTRIAVNGCGKKKTRLQQGRRGGKRRNGE